MTLFTRLLFSMALLVGAGSVTAEGASDVTTKKTTDANENWYQVEVLIFAQVDNFGDESASASEQLSYPAELIDVEDSDSPFPLITKDERQLGPEAYTLGRSNNYRVLYHQAWRQPGRGSANMPWVRIAGGSKHGAHHELEGSVRVYLSRFLHLETDLWKIVPGSNTDSSGSGSGADSDPDSYHSAASPDVVNPDLRNNDLLDDDLQDSGLQNRTFENPTAEPPIPRHVTLPAIPGNHLAVETMVTGKAFTLRESRQIAPGELYYLDHANMGMLVKVNRVQP
ncbi:MAG: CsiV family protein [Porticoccaceae bacterium]